MKVHTRSSVRTVLSWCALMALLMIGANSLAQSNGTIVGTAHDQTGAVVPSVSIAIHNIDTGLTRALQTDQNGIYSAAQLPVGNYEITASARGFATVVRTGIQLQVAQVARVDFTMTVSNVEQKVEVSGDVPLVDTQTISLGDVEASERIVELPLNKRDFYQLAVLQPGVLPPYSNRGSVGLPLAAGQMQSQPEVNGLRESDNYSLLDGASINDPFYNTATVVPNPDAIAEFKMQTNLTSARYGRGAGAVINIVTKSGTNALHGGLYDFERSDIFDARNYFVPFVPFLQRQQFGANLGGAIKTDKSFFFASYEGLRQREGDPISAIVPSLQDRVGNLSDQAGPIINPFTGQPFSGPNNFDPSLINPLARKVINLYPVPNAGPDVWIGAPIGRQNSDQGIVRWDQTLSERQNLGARYIFQNQTAIHNFNQFAFSGPLDSPGFPESDSDVTSNFVIWDTLATTKLVNDLRFSYQRNSDKVGHPLNTTGHYDFGFTFPQAGDAQYGDVLPQFGLGGFSSVGNADGDIFRTYSVFQLQDTLTFNRGKHSIAIGGDTNHLLLDSKAYFIRMGVYYFLGYATGNPVADMLLGQPSLFATTLGDPTRAFRSTGLNGFFEDTYRVKPRLTLIFGLRYELQTAPIETHNRLAMFSPQNAAAGIVSTLHPEAPPGLVFAGDPGFPRSLIPTRKTNFGPRVGFAWDVTGDGKTSLRAGYGIFYDQSPIMAYVDSSLNPPQSPYYLYAPNDANPDVMENPIAGISYIPQTQAQADIPGTKVAPVPNLAGPGIHNVTPRVEQWNLTLQRSLTKGLGLDVSYVGNLATHLLGTVDANQPVFMPGNTNAFNAQQRRPFPLYGTNFTHESDFSSNYQGLQMSATQRFRHGVSFVASYTWSKTIDDDSQSLTYFHILGQAVLPQNTYDLQAEHGLSAFNIPQRLVLSGTWELPGYDTKQEGLARLTAGWALSMIFTANAGFPFTVVDSLNPSFTEEYGPTDRPNVVGNPNNGPKTAAQWFNTSAFQALAPGEGFGDSRRNMVIGPGFTDLDLSVAKNIKITERLMLQFRAEFFNALNHANFQVPINDIASPNFGEITETNGDNREMQFGLKLNF